MKNMEKNSAGSFLVQFLIGQSATSGSLLKKIFLGLTSTAMGSVWMPISKSFPKLLSAMPKYLLMSMISNRTTVLTDIYYYCAEKAAKNCSIQDISEALEESPDTITPLVELIKQYPDASTEQIFEKLNEQNVILH